MAEDHKPGGSRRPLAVGLLIVVAAVVVAFLAFGDRNPNSAEFGREGTRTLDGVPDDLPGDVLPESAVEVEGLVSRTGGDWSAAVSYVFPGPRDEVTATVNGVLLQAGYTQRQRSFDERSLLIVYDGIEGRTISASFQDIDAGTGVAVVLRGTDSGSS